MEILNEYKNGREGNDCWISDYIILIKLDTNLFVVVHTDTVCGSWTGNHKTTRAETFVDYVEAMNYFESIVEKLEK